MVDAVLTQQVASILAQALPYLVSAPETANNEAPEIVKNMFGEGWWNKTKHIFEIIRPEVEKKPEAVKVFKDAAVNAEDALAQAALTHELQGLLEDMPIESINEIRTIISEINFNNTIALAQGEKVVPGNAPFKESEFSRFAPLPGLDPSVKPQLYHCRQCDETILAQDILWIKSKPYCDKCKSPVEPL